jgi:transcriptional regulator with XRE-family HTH domain
LGRKDTEIGQTLGENIRKFIKKRGYQSVERFAYENAIDKSALSKILRGERRPQVNTLVFIAEALEVTLQDLYPMPKARPFPTRLTK